MSFRFMCPVATKLTINEFKFFDIFSLKIDKSVEKSNRSHLPRQGVSGSLLPATCLYSALERYDQWSLNKYHLNLHPNSCLRRLVYSNIFLPFIGIFSWLGRKTSLVLSMSLS